MVRRTKDQSLLCLIDPAHHFGPTVNECLGTVIILYRSSLLGLRIWMKISDSILLFFVFPVLVLGALLSSSYKIECRLTMELNIFFDQFFSFRPHVLLTAASLFIV